MLDLSNQHHFDRLVVKFMGRIMSGTDEGSQACGDGAKLSEDLKKIMVRELVRMEASLDGDAPISQLYAIAETTADDANYKPERDAFERLRLALIELCRSRSVAFDGDQTGVD